MKLNNAIELYAFKEAIAKSEGAVWLESIDGDKFNLKSIFSQYLGLAELIKDRSTDLELFCQLPEDRALFYKFFQDNPEAN